MSTCKPDTLTCGHPREAARPEQIASDFMGAGTRIGVFDSGVGGLSVLRAIHARLPAADLIYVADSAHAPYGERDEAYIIARTAVISQFLVDQGVNAIVAACNTATAAAVHLLRATYPKMPIVGVEPGVKPAVVASSNKRVGVLATPSTLTSRKFQRLLDLHGKGATIVSQPCPGLAREIELGVLDTPNLRALVKEFTAPLKASSVDTVVLGCTHYPFIAPLLSEALGPDVLIIDTACSVAEHTARLCATKASPTLAEQSFTKGVVSLFTSGAPDHLTSVYSHWFGMALAASRLP